MALSALKMFAPYSGDAASAPGGRGNGAANRVAVWIDGNNLTSFSGFTYDGTTFSVPIVTAISVSAGNNLTLSKSNNAPTIQWTGGGSNNIYMDLASGTFRVLNNGATEILQTSQAGSVIVGSGSVTTSATDGFLYITSCNGTPSGAPTAFAGRLPLVYDYSTNKFYVYNGAWKSVTLS